MSGGEFFDESTSRSKAKINIVFKYFVAWAKVIVPRVLGRGDKIAYIDLYAGRGCYEDGTKSTPLLVLEQAIKDDQLRDVLVTIFNDRSRKNLECLRRAVGDLPGIDTLKHPPQFDTQDVGDKIADRLRQNHLVPTLLFFDPWGYKGLSLKLINAVLKDWACECVFLFNYNRINAGLANPAVADHINLVFGKGRADALRLKLEGLPPAERERATLGELVAALRGMGRRYILPFRFTNNAGTRTSHYLVFVSKNSTGHEIMKEVMASASSSYCQGVPSFEYNPARVQQPLLLETNRPLDALQKMLLDDFAGQRVTARELYERHSVGKLYILRNYKDALRNLEMDGSIIVNPPAGSRPMRNGEVTFGNEVQVTFSVKVVSRG